MSIKGDILNSFQIYLEKYSENDQKLEIINSIVGSMDRHVAKYEKYLEKKEKYINDINEIVTLFFYKYENYYYHIKQYNAYYEYNDGVFNLISSDKILVTISKFIPVELIKYKSIIQKIIMNDIKKNFLFRKTSGTNFNLNKKTYKNVKSLFSKILSNKLNSADHEKSLMYILAFISKCMTDSDYLGDDYIQLWYGQSSQKFVEIIKEIFVDLIKTYPKKLNNIKFNYNNYDLSKIKLIKFGELDDIDSFIKECRGMKESIIATIFYLDQLLPNGGCVKILEQKISIINSFNKYKNKENFFNKLTNENIIEDKDGILYLKELYNFLQNLFSELELPHTVFTFNELAEYMEMNYSKFIDQSSLTTILLRKIPQNSNESENDIWLEGRPSVKNGEKIEIVKGDSETEFVLVRTYNGIEGYVKNDNLLYTNSDSLPITGIVKIKVTDSRANLTFRGIFLKGYDKATMFQEFSKGQITKCPNGVIRLRELYDILKRWYYKNDNYISFPTRNDITVFMNNLHIKHWDTTHNVYKGLKFIDYDKHQYLIDFIADNIKPEMDSYIKVDDFYTTFKNWFRSHNEDYLYPDKEDILEYMNKLYTYKKYKGWQDIKFTKNINKLSESEINEIKEQIIFNN